MGKETGLVVALVLAGLLAGCVAVVPLGQRETETRTEAGRTS